MKKMRALILLSVTLALNAGFFVHAQTTTSYSPENLTIDFMRKQSYPGSDLKIEQKLPSDKNYDQYIASYLSQGLKIYGLLSVPKGQPPVGGWPVIVFLHGYIRPSEYKTTEKYILYVHAMASHGYIVFKPDLRGNGNSEGQPESQYFAPDYTIDTLNAIATMKKYKDANPNKIGLWGHSDGGNIIMRAVTVDTTDIKAAVSWGGVVAPYSVLTTDWQTLVPFQQEAEDRNLENNHMSDLISLYGTPNQNPDFWNSIDPLNYLSDIQTPIQFDVGGEDEQVPPIFSYNVRNKLRALGKSVQYIYYSKKNHNIAYPVLPTYMHLAIPYAPAMQNTLDFFDKYLK